MKQIKDLHLAVIALNNNLKFGRYKSNNYPLTITILETTFIIIKKIVTYLPDGSTRVSFSDMYKRCKKG
jgi:hypothetical protein